MMKVINSRLIIMLAIAMLCITAFTADSIYAQKKFVVARSIYAGWQPWVYAEESGILKKWADHFGIQIQLAKMDYIPSIEAYVAKKADACVMTNMEALDMPAASGITTQVIIVGDFSNGNDAVLTRNNLGIKDLSGQEIYLVELSVSHYLLVRGLEQNGLKESDVTILNTSDSDIAPAFIANENQNAVVTWNPLVMEIMQEPGISNVYNSSQTPGEILDLMVAREEVISQYPEFGYALTATWYEVMGIMSKRGSADDALKIMSDDAGCSVTEYKQQLRTTAMFYTPKEAVEYTKSAEIKTNMDYVRNFCFTHGLLGEDASSVDEVGIKYPDGTVQGDKKNVQLIFDTSFMEKAANGEYNLK
jgi:NitT/TauT family transport system substrate-binding protein